MTVIINDFKKAKTAPETPATEQQPQQQVPTSHNWMELFKPTAAVKSYFRLVK